MFKIDFISLNVQSENDDITKVKANLLIVCPLQSVVENRRC